MAALRMLGLCVMLLVASAAAQRIHVDKTSLTVSEGFYEVITFTLDEPIICTTQDGECAVVIEVQNPHPNQVAIDNCIIKWDWQDWHQPRTLVIRAVEDFVDDGTFEGMIVTDPAISRSEYYKNYNAADIVIKTRPRRSAQCSGTGDPHYHTFDRKYWHIVDAGRYVLYKTRSRTFEVQVQTRAYPARHCAFAAREDNDVVVVWACNGNPVVRRSCGSDECRRGGFPKLSIRGSSRRANYYVEFKSGAMVRADTQPYYMSMYLTAPGRDFNDVEGVCGNFDGNPNNDAPVYYARSVNQLWSSQRPSYDLFAWYPSPSPPSPPPRSYEECTYEEPPFVRPILNRPDAEDITSFIKDLNLNDVIDNEDVVIGGSSVDESLNAMDRNLAVAQCDDVISNSHVVAVCQNNLPGFDFTAYIEDCADDLAETSNVDFIEDALEALERDCAERASRDLNTWETDENENPVEPNKEIQTNICPSQCNNRGTCDEGICTCDEGFLGFDCSIDTNARPVITSLVKPFCDTKGINECTGRLSVIGEGFWNSDKLRCRFGDMETDAFFLGSMEVACAVPNKVHSGSDEETAVVQVTVDGDNWSESQEFVFTWYDGVCQVCNAHGCGPNPESCTIDGTCYHNTAPNSDNICQQCDPSTSVTEWTWTYQNHEECGPSFPKGTPTVTVVGGAEAGDVIYTVDASNSKVAADTSNVITYSLTGGDGLFAISNDGVITAAQAFNVLDLDVTFNNFLSIVATDSAGNEATTGIVIDAVAENVDPYFSDSYSVEVPEDVQVGSVIISVQAQDRNEDDSLTYSWFSTEEGYGDYFLIDETTGDVTVNRELDFEDRDLFTLVVRARDNGGQTHVTTLEVTVTDVAEAPNGVAIDSDSLEENSAPGTVVGTLSTQDPDDVDGTQSFTYSTSSSVFAIDGDKLVTAPGSSFDFEAGPTEYEVEVTTTDQDGLTFTDTLTVSIVDVNEKPYNVRLNIPGSEQGNFMIEESAPLDSIVGTIEKQDDDADQTVLCSLASTDNGHFEISGNNLVLIDQLDYEEDNEHMITVVCVDDGTPTLASDPVTFVIHVTNVDDGPSDFAFEGTDVSVPEDAQVGDVVARVVAVDVDGGDSAFDFSIVRGKFAVPNAPDCEAQQDGSVRCVVDLVLAEALDFETAEEETFTIEADSNGRVGSARLTIPVANVNEPVSAIQWADGVNTIPEDVDAGVLVGTLLPVDPDTTTMGVAYNFELLTNTDVFELVPLMASAGSSRRRRANDADAYGAEVRVKDPSALDYEDESKRSFTLSLRVTDNADTPVSSVVEATVEVTDAPLRLVTAPDFITVSENASVNTQVATVSLEGNDHAGVPYTITLVDDANGAFRLDGDKIVVNGALNFEVAQAHELTFEVDTQETPLPTFAVVVGVRNVDDAPVISIDSVMQEVNSDIRVGQTVFSVDATDEDGTGVDVQLEVSAGSLTRESLLLQVFGYRASTQSVFVRQTPSTAGLPLGTYHMRLVGTSGIGSTSVEFTITVFDDCRSNQCAATETCVDRFGSYDCCEGATCVNSADAGFDTRFDTTTTTTQAPSTSNSADTTTDENGNGPNGGNVDLSRTDASNSGASVGLIVGVVVGAICLIALVAVVVILAMRRRNDPGRLFLAAEEGSKTYMSNPTYRSPQEPVYAQADGRQTVAFVPGASNPLYEWYQPDMTRQECTDSLTDAPAGSFIVRDSKATPGWHMIGVRTESAVVHEKIKRGDDGMYELLPASNAPQPAFQDIPSLVYHYSEPRADVPFVLSASSLSNPMYAMSQNASTGQYAYAPGSAIPHDAAAPAVPIKEKERAAVEQVAAMDDGELYTNTTDAQAALHSSA
ncbi:hypothetical protein PTSG_04390 [Salpingoeca rosetta]|uniref:Uncharacterized protein n=1 Tax=Salpingoeca rosetta (strain ATCC 50818 / BSB-021) TaxID=946362 RepID=F2U8E8_SALR5|nr:uncharacterized protein PTSG_04390 [Salpingoeca rosetta]EGD72656.1 hypothetical protein PTSG_04390 [Salpingoeca rosetta]|eukprot:XP_004994479.1 hypothetical protein PTSG_04390 [Salpingoeca rosetta]